MGEFCRESPSSSPPSYTPYDKLPAGASGSDDGHDPNVHVDVQELEQKLGHLNIGSGWMDLMAHHLPGMVVDVLLDDSGSMTDPDWPLSYDTRIKYTKAKITRYVYQCLISWNMRIV